MEISAGRLGGQPIVTQVGVFRREITRYSSGSVEPHSKRDLGRHQSAPLLEQGRFANG